MKDILEYLNDPMKKGVAFRLFEFDINGLIKIAKKLKLDDWVENEDDEQEFVDDYFNDEMFEHNLTDVMIAFYKDKNDEDFFHFSNIDENELTIEVDSELKKYERDRLEVMSELMWNKSYNMFDSGVRNHYLDSLSFSDVDDKISKKNRIKYIEVISIKPDILNDLEKLILKMSSTEGSIKIIKNRVTHSSRYVYRPYQHSLDIWLNSKLSLKIHKDLRDLLINAAEYHDREEWRTSVILCAIVTELILADVFEEQYETEAPDIPLGALNERVKSNPNMTPEIQKNVSELNKIRISAVHRSKSPISERDSELALVNIYQIINWYSDKY